MMLRRARSCVPLLGLLAILGASTPAPSLAGPPAGTARPPGDDVARWDDRSTPRRMLETFFYAIFVYDLAPELIVNAIDCLELGEMEPRARERDAALMAHELSGVLSRRSDVSLYGVPDGPVEGPVMLVDDGDVRIEIARQPDGSWRFSRDTVGRIPRMRAAGESSRRTFQESRSRLAEGRTDPEATLRTFLHAAMVNHDFSAASQCLDLRDVPLKLHAVHGPEQARKLLFVMQRCAFAFPQECPSDPDGWRFIWHSNHRGRIMIDRVPTADGLDAWLFSRMTLRNLDALVEGFRDVPPDPRYARIGQVIGADMLTDTLETVPPPPNVPRAQGSPRAALRTFLEAADEMEFDDRRGEDVLACLDLEEIPAEDRTSMGLRLGAKLHTLLRSLDVDVQGLSDSWEAEATRLNPEGALALTLARQADGAWRFDKQSVSHVPALFGRLSAEDKALLERRSPFCSAQHAVRTLLTDVERGDLDHAADALALGGIPAGARGELGPLLALKLGFILERLGGAAVQDVPSDADGPRHYLYRGSLGRISLARGADPARPADWAFTPETVRQVDPIFQSLLRGAPPAAAARLPLALRLRAAAPTGLTFPVLGGLAGYQWIGLVLAAAASVPVAWAFLRIVHAASGPLARAARLNLSDEFLCRKVRPLGFQVGVWAFYLQLPLLDLPIDLVGRALPAFKLLGVGLLAWASWRLIDLGMAVYTNSEHVKVRNNLNDMIVPTGLRILKLAVLLGAACFQVSLIGNGELLTRLLAGLGLIGLAASLAAQDTLKNFFGTLLLIGEHPFKIGDAIVVGGMEGTVESVGFRSTRLRTPEDSLLTVPNSLIAAASIDNRGLRKSRRYRCLVAMAYDTPVDRMIALRDGLREVATSRPDLIRADRVDVHIFGLGGPSVDLLVNVHFWAEDSRGEMESRDWLNREVLRLAGGLGVEIAQAAGPSIPLAPPGPPVARIDPAHPAGHRADRTRRAAADA